MPWTLFAEIGEVSGSLVDFAGARSLERAFVASLRVDVEVTQERGHRVRLRTDLQV